ncbi:MAG: hypothetical protein PHX83_13450 [Acidobacteriia bacterium]|nr:hypothetical protein [Terriglobia bacterium]
MSLADWVIQIAGILAALGGAIGIGMVCLHYALLVWYNGEAIRHEHRARAYEARIKMLQTRKQYSLVADVCGVAEASAVAHGGEAVLTP